MMRARSAEVLLKIVSRLLIGVVAVVVTLAVVLLARGFVKGREAAADNVEIRSIEHDLDLAKPPTNSPKTPESAGKSIAVVGTLELALAKAADGNKCQLTEFKASPDTTNYISLYRREAAEPGWKQSQLHFTVDGSLGDVVETIRGLGSSNVPVEIDSIVMSRIKVEKGGKARISAQVQLRALWKEG